MRRREFITLLGGTAATWPLAARAQQAGQIARIGFLGTDPDNAQFATSYPAFLAELRKLGFTEGQNLIVEYRRMDEGASKAFAGAAELIRSNVGVVVTFGPEIALKAAVAASQTTPIVMIAVNFDPIAGGYVSDLARPNGNITGLVYRAPELAAKQLELLMEAFPNNKPIAALWEPASAEQFDAAQRTAQSVHIELRSHKVENLPFDFDEAFRSIAQEGSRMVLVLSGPTFTAQRAHIADLAMQHRLPTMFTFKAYVEAGGLMSYGIDTIPIFRRAASFVAKILRGAKPSDLPVEQPTNFEFTLNLKTAKAIGVSIPTSILLRADEVIE
ncbi:MAG TPA: ABC transporter substrate-binding protein [Lacipirellulaceae bacterium]|nr:ABC transporter substrate-binding protein [Lacipirellulaceae bacterium]